MPPKTDQALPIPFMADFGAQVRAGRALLGWSANTLAKRADLSPTTISRLESAQGMPRTLTSGIFAIVSAFADAGVEMILPGAGSTGVGGGVRFYRFPAQSGSES